MAQQHLNYGTTAGDGTGEILFNAFKKVEDNFDELYKKRFGIYDYANTLPTQEILYPDTAILQNDGSGTNSYFNKLNGVDDVFNTSTNQFDFSNLEIGDYFTIRMDLDIETTSENQNVQAKFNLGIGSSNPYSLSLFNMNFKTSLVYPVSNITTFIYIGNTDTKDYPAEIEAMSEYDVNITVKGWALIVHKQLP